MKKYLLLTAVVVILAGVAVWWQFGKVTPSPVPTPVSDKSDLIRVTSPMPNDTITSPLTVKGEARGTWFFEASFPVILEDSNGSVIGQIPAHADGDWMTENFVPFTATIEFKTPTTTAGAQNNGTLVLKKDNPSGMPEKDDSLEIPVNFGGTSGVAGRVLLGPTCPVERIPPDPKCADKPYETTVQVIKLNSPDSVPFTTGKTDKNGNFKIILPPGNYALQAVGGSPLPRCGTTDVIVAANRITNVNLSCDTGIR
jgi:hypothetical protein